MPKAALLLVITKLELGGAQKNVLDLAAGLDRGKFDIFLFTAAEGLLMEEALAFQDITVVRSRFLDRPLNPVKDLLALIELFLFIRRRRITIVHTHSSKAGILGRIAAAAAGAAVCHSVHGWSFNDCRPALQRVCSELAEKAAAGFTRRFIVVSAHDRGKGLARGIGAAGNYSLIRYGIHRSEFERPDSAARRKQAAPVIGTVACLKPQKAPGDFLRCAGIVCRDFPDARFTLAGDGVLRGDLLRRARLAGLEKNFFLCGWRRDIPSFLASLDVFCLTSLWEGLPIALIEAMAASLPVVCTDTGGVRELIEHGVNGFIVPRRDMEGMASIVAGLLNDPAQRRRVGSAAALALGDEFTVETMVRRTAGVYDELCTGKSKPRRIR